MKVTRCDSRTAHETSPSDWPVLVDEKLEAEWEGYRDIGDGGFVGIRADAPDFRYEVQLRGEEFGVLLGSMPPEAVPAVLGQFLRVASPELIGAVSGHIIAYVAALAPKPHAGS
jgi:hypothetical protein